MSGSATQQIVNKAWSFAHVLRDDGLSYMGYTEQITFLLFLKMADEQAKLPGAKASIIPKGKKGEPYDWPGDRYSMVLTNPPSARRARSPSSTKRAIWKRRTPPTRGRTSGPAPRTSSSTSCSTSRRSSR